MGGQECIRLIVMSLTRVLDFVLQYTNFPLGFTKNNINIRDNYTYFLVSSLLNVIDTSHSFD